MQARARAQQHSWSAGEGTPGGWTRGLVLVLGGQGHRRLALLISTCSHPRFLSWGWNSAREALALRGTRSAALSMRTDAHSGSWGVLLAASAIVGAVVIVAGVVVARSGAVKEAPCCDG